MSVVPAWMGVATHRGLPHNITALSEDIFMLQSALKVQQACSEIFEEEASCGQVVAL